MEQVYSKVKEDCLLLSLVRSSDVTENRIDLSPEEEYLQVAVKKLTKGTSFKPHKHKELKRNTDLTQEARVFLSGRVRAKFYDLDDNLVNIIGGCCGTDERFIKEISELTKNYSPRKIKYV